jgi:hypothetical protein
MQTIQDLVVNMESDNVIGRGRATAPGSLMSNTSNQHAHVNIHRTGVHAGAGGHYDPQNVFGRHFTGGSEAVLASG